jgi:raffinose/stachyose/melibiose transport system permease protein
LISKIVKTEQIRPKKKKRISSDSVQAVAMLAPTILGFITFTYIPIFYILRYAFYQSNGFVEQYIGWDNFVRVFTRDKDFWDSILNTLILSGGKLAIEIPLALFLAVLLNKAIKGMAFFRVALFLPAIISTAIVGLIFSLMFSSYNGIINNILMNMNFIKAPIDWFGSKWTSMTVLGLASIWNYFGINMIFFMMALQSVPKELYECAAIDGVTPIKRFFYITLPMIGPIFQVVVLMAIVGSLKVSDLVLSSTNGAPGGSTEVVMTYVFKYFFGYSGKSVQVGYASAMAMVTGIILAIISLLYMKVSNKMSDV